MIKIFQQYPEIFPSGYFRFLGARLQNHIDKKTLWYKNGVILTWIKYQKTVKKKPKCIIKPGDVKLDQIVNKNQGNLKQSFENYQKSRYLRTGQVQATARIYGQIYHASDVVAELRTKMFTGKDPQNYDGVSWLYDGIEV